VLVHVTAEGGGGGGGGKQTGRDRVNARGHGRSPLWILSVGTERAGSPQGPSKEGVTGTGCVDAAIRESCFSVVNREGAGKLSSGSGRGAKVWLYEPPQEEGRGSKRKKGESYNIGGESGNAADVEAIVAKVGEGR